MPSNKYASEKITIAYVRSVQNGCGHSFANSFFRFLRYFRSFACFLYIYSFFHPFVRSFVFRSFVRFFCSFVHSFVHVLTI